MHLVYRVRQIILLFGDLFCFVIAFWLSLFARSFAVPNWFIISANFIQFFSIFLIWIIINYINGLYDLGKQGQDLAFYRRLVETAGISLVTGITFFYIIPELYITPKTLLMLNIFFGYSMVGLWRFVYAGLIGAKRLQTRLLLVGYSPEMQDLINILSHNNEHPYKISALIDPAHTIKAQELPQIDVYHGLNTIRPAVTNYKIDIVVIAPELNHDQETLRELYELLFWNVKISDFASFYEMVTGRIPPSTFSEAWFLEHLKNARQPIYDRFRIAADIIIGVCLFILLVVLFPFIVIGIKLSSPGPIFYKQKRVGQSGREFTLYKFRSMYVLSEDGSAEIGGVEFAKKDDKRVTAMGKFLRKTRLDELPQVINLLKRDVTLIGPRPERPEIIKKLEAKIVYYPLRHLVRPGLTGWALINQNYTDNYDTSLQKLQYDLYYIKNRSFLLDIAILLRTINVILRMMGQ